MQLVPHRLVRRTAQRADPETHLPTPREEATRKNILAMGQEIMAEHGPWRVGWSAMAHGMGHATATLRKYFVDQDVLLAAILEQHLHRIARCFATVPRDAPNRDAALRAAYLGVTRTGYGALTEAHHLLVHDRHRLPPDERAPIEDALRHIGDIVAGRFAAQILPLLDSPAYPAPLIETLVAALHQAAIPEHRPQQAAPPPEPPPPRKNPAPPARKKFQAKDHHRPIEGENFPSLMESYWAAHPPRAGPQDTS